jgi:probable HAF family extracellular repeat protein
MSLTTAARSSVHRVTTLSIALLTVLAALCGVAGAQSTTYTITDLGALPGPTPGASYGAAINASGDVAGTAYTSTGEIHAALFRKGTVKDLGVLPGGNASFASGINGYDEVTGYSQFPASQSVTDTTRAFLYSAGKMQDLGALPGDQVSEGAAINDAGQITGTSTNQFVEGSPLPPNHGFIYSAGEMTSLAASDPNVIASRGFGINAAGQVTGWARLSTDPNNFTAAVFSNSSATLLNLHLPPGIPSEGYAITDSGQLTGLFYHFDGTTSAFLYNNAVETPIAPLPHDSYSFGNSINAAGQVVGGSLGPSGQHHAFLYTPGQGTVDVNTLLPTGSGWTLGDATGINDKGQITGGGYRSDGTARAYLLSPVLVPFSKLDGAVDISGTRQAAFAASGSFTLGAGSNGINPLTETMVLELGGYHLTIPPASFATKYGGFFYQGKIGNVAVEALIWSDAANRFLFEIAGEGAAGLPSGCPPSVVLTIGDDTGTEEIRTGDEGAPRRFCESRSKR